MVSSLQAHCAKSAALQGVADGTGAVRRLLQASPDNVTVYYNVGGVPEGDIDSLPDTLNATGTLNTFRQLLVTNGAQAFPVPRSGAAEYLHCGKSRPEVLITHLRHPAVM